MDQEADVNEERMAGAASTQGAIMPREQTKIQMQVVLKNERHEYLDDAKRVCQKMIDCLNKDPELFNALAYLARNTPFSLYVYIPEEEKKIITLS